MPQMMPLNWLMLMMFFIIIFYFFSNLIFYNLLHLPKSLTIMKTYLKYTWKW
uniref:ATP synthase F0 subunit 8 n=1 Tax=Agetocera filicornis TaxID=1391560 RepID=UPI00286BD0C1|nr:ATP synthase F0 subunit 8 [Agetocera filicornis]WKW54884.1 ATP synthase F0 subunit 8 [Agetocera filicornis]